MLPAGSDLGRPLLIAALVLTEVGLWQWRVVLAMRGGRLAAMALGAVGAVLQITAISQVVTHVADPLSITAYAFGVGFGVLLGMVVGERFTPGYVGVTIITATTGVADALRSSGWPMTVSDGEGEEGPVAVIYAVVARREEGRLRHEVAVLAPDAFWSTEELRGARSPQLAPATT